MLMNLLDPGDGNLDLLTLEVKMLAADTGLYCPFVY